MYMTRALRYVPRELVSHDKIVVLYLLQVLNSGEDGSGSGIEPFTKPNLFMALEAKNTDLAQLMQFSDPVNGCNVSTIPGLPVAGRK